MTRIVAIVGKFTHEGITASLKARDLEARHINLYGVSSKTWAKRIDSLISMRESGRLAGVILHFPTAMVIEGAQEKYRAELLRLFDEAALSKAVAFVFSDNLNLKFRPTNSITGELMSDAEFERLIDSDLSPNSIWLWRYEAIKQAESNINLIEEMFKELYQRKIDVSPFYKRDDITIKLQDFLDEVDKDIFLRMYVPNQRFQADQLDGLLRTFERYLRQVENKRFKIEAKTTSTGTLYVFCGLDGDETFQNLEEAFQRFDEFMKLCRDDPEQSILRLKSTGLAPAEMRFLAAKYARDYQRILIDTKHEFQQKILLLSQRFDLETLNVNEESLLDSLKMKGPTVLFDVSGNTGSISLSVGSLELSRSDYNEIGRIINSNISYNSNDEQILDLISKYSDRIDAIQLRSDLDQAKTLELPEPERKIARGRLVSFLFKTSSKFGDKLSSNIIADLVDYITKGIGL